MVPPIDSVSDSHTAAIGFPGQRRFRQVWVRVELVNTGLLEGKVSPRLPSSSIQVLKPSKVFKVVRNALSPSTKCYPHNSESWVPLEVSGGLRIVTFRKHGKERRLEPELLIL